MGMTHYVGRVIKEIIKNDGKVGYELSSTNSHKLHAIDELEKKGIAVSNYIERQDHLHGPWLEVEFKDKNKVI